MISLWKYYKASQSILGLNERNLEYTLPENPKEARAIADSKLRAKKILAAAGIPVPTTYAVIRSKKQLDNFDWDTLPSSFVLKPNKGFGGQGILIAYGEKKRKNSGTEREWVTSNSEGLSLSDIKTHVFNILEGSFSLKNGPDQAVFEHRLRNTPELKPYLYKGVPDIRVVVYNKVPIMAELRLPTKKSNGKANLHAGGVGVGIDIASGITTIAIQNDQIIEDHPDTEMRLGGFTIPHWDKILEMAIKAQVATELGYIGADIALDKEMGPVMLEINARPGLAIQIANEDGLKERLKRVSKLKVKTVKRGIRIGKELFGGEVEEEVEEMLGRKIIGLSTKASISSSNNKNIEIDAKIDSGAGITSIDLTIARELGFGPLLDKFSEIHLPKDINNGELKEYYKKNKQRILEENPWIDNIMLIKSGTGNTIRPVVQVKLTVEGIEQEAKVTIIDRSHLKYPVIIGLNNLSHFIIDPLRR